MKRRGLKVRSGVRAPALIVRHERACKKCGAPCLLTQSMVDRRMIWCSPCRQKQPSHWPEFNSWKAMIGRCTRPDNHRWHDYGGRGITVCKRWLDSYEAFLADMGRRPTGVHSLDRIDNNGNYEPENCRWATREEQYANMRSNRIIVVGRRRMTMSAAARARGLRPGTLQTRLKRGWPLKDALRSALGAR